MAKKKKNKYYVVWEGMNPGIYGSWEECQQQIKGYPNAKYKGFRTKADAEQAFQGSYIDHYNTSKPTPKMPLLFTHSRAHINMDSWSVDGACSGNPGMMEYRGVQTANGNEIFRVGPLPGGTNNIAEILAIIHALALLEKEGDTKTAIYTDSRIALSWYKQKKIKTQIKPTSNNQKVLELVRRAEQWMKTHHPPNKILKWDTQSWGEIPADFGRK